jgi:hypothetical protein
MLPESWTYPPISIAWMSYRAEPLGRLVAVLKVDALDLARQHDWPSFDEQKERADLGDVLVCVPCVSGDMQPDLGIPSEQDARPVYCVPVGMILDELREGLLIVPDAVDKLRLVPLHSRPGHFVPGAL